MERRIDRITALLIDAVLNAEAVHGIAHSARRLEEVGISVNIAVRLLTRRGERRNYSAPTAWDAAS